MISNRANMEKLWRLLAGGAKRKNIYPSEEGKGWKISSLSFAIAS